MNGSRDLEPFIFVYKYLKSLSPEPTEPVICAFIWEFSTGLKAKNELEEEKKEEIKFRVTLLCRVWTSKWQEENKIVYLFQLKTIKAASTDHDWRGFVLMCSALISALSEGGGSSGLIPLRLLSCLTFVWKIRRLKIVHILMKKNVFGIVRVLIQGS